MPRGGRRPNAGRKPKALAEKLLDGNPGKRDIKIIRFDDKTDNFDAKKGKNAPKYIDISTDEYKDVLPDAAEILNFMRDYVRSAGCENLIADFLLEDFAQMRRAYLECEYQNKTAGRTVDGRRSPYVAMGLDYHKQMMAVYNHIWGIVAKSSETKYESKSGFFELLKNKGF